MSLTEKYRPQTWEEVVGQEPIVKSLKEMAENKEMKPPHILLIGKAGTGKNTLARIFAKTYLGEGWETNFHEYNASDDRKLETIREKIKPQSRLSVDQVINLTEIDGMLSASQEALRRIMETGKNTVFILDANNETKIIEPLQSRCATYRMLPLSEEQIITRLYDICDKEKIKTTFSQEEQAGFTQIYKISKGDMRKAINELSKLITANREINVENVLELNKSVNLTLCSIKSALEGDFEKAKAFMEDALLLSGNNIDLILDSLTDAIVQLENYEVKLRLSYELGILEHHLHNTHRPLLTFGAFLAFATKCPHLK